MKPEANAEIVLSGGADKPASPVSTYNFIVSFGSESYSAAVIPNGTAELQLHKRSQVRLQFLVESATAFLKPGAPFTFFEGGRTGEGTVL